MEPGSMTEPTWDETEPVFEETTEIPAAPSAQPEEVTGLQAFLSGIAKGGSFGSSDEIKGGVETVTEGTPFENIPEPFKTALTLQFAPTFIADKAAKVTVGQDSAQSVLDKYRKSRDEQRTLEATRAEAQPEATLAGELVGGFAVPIPGAPLVKGAGFLAKAGHMAKLGAKGGAAAGLGLSEADLTEGEILPAIKDTAGSAAVGAVAGPMLQAMGSGVSSTVGGLGKIAKSFPLVQDTVDVFKRSKAGQDLLGQVEPLSQANRNLAREVIDTLETYRMEAGKLMQSSLDKAEASNLKVNLTGVVKELREKIASMNPVEEYEKKDLESFKKLLSNVLEEEERTVNRYIREIKPPKATNLEKAEGTVAKKTAEAEAKDLIKRQELQAELEEAVAMGDEEGIKYFGDKLGKLTNLTEYPPINILDETTGLPALGVPRGPYKSPIVSAIPPEAQPQFTPLKLMTETTTVPRRTEASPSEVGELLKSATTAGDKAETHVGKGLSRELKDLLGTTLDKTLSESPETAQAKGAYDYAKGGFQQVAKTQENLGLPGYFTSKTADKKVDAINKLQRAIQETQKPGSMGKQVINEALDNLQKLDPEMADSFRQRISEGSRTEYLARELGKESALSKDPSTLYAAGKSIFLLGARGAGKAAGGAADASKGLVNLGNRVYEASPEALKTMADSAVQQGKPFGTVLQKVISAPASKRKALLFTLMQQPEFREFARTFGGEEEVP